MELNKIYHGDCFKLLSGIPDKSIDLIVTDPPYLHTKGHYYNKKTGKLYKDGHTKYAQSELFSNKGYTMSTMSQFNEEKINDSLKEFVRVLRKPNMYIFCNETQVPLYCNWATDNNLMFSILVWEKPLSIINKNRFSQNIEFIIRIYDYGTALNKLDGYNDFYNRVKHTSPVYKKSHPTQKPIDLVSQFILLNTDIGDVVLDPFSGSGTTAVACHRTKRKYICFEINKEFYDLSVKRINDENSQLKLF